MDKADSLSAVAAHLLTMTPLLSSPASTSGFRFTRQSKDVSRFRSSEWFVLAYFTYVAVAGAFFQVGLRPWLLLAATAASVAILSRRKSILRDLAPLAYTLAAYREMNWFTPAIHHHQLELAWIVWDRILLDDLHLRQGIESAGVVVPAVLELCYCLVYAVGAVAVAILLLNKRRDQIDRFWLAYLVGTLGAYALFPYFPSEPPRVVFPGADLPHVVTAIRRFNLWVVGGYGIHSSVFPSAHVSSALSAGWGLMAAIPERRWIGGLLLAYGLSVAVATVYGRYHFATDAVAGVAISLMALMTTRLGGKS
jgi:membrane-associated phospholipid phosphatase